MKQYETFVFERYELNGNEARFRYSYDGIVNFEHVIAFGFDFANGYPEVALDRVLRSLWLLAGVSYYKAVVPGKIKVKNDELSYAEAQFLSETYRLGLGQFCYENKLSLDRIAKFEGTDTRPVPAIGLGDGGDLVALGGGKDSLVTTTILEEAHRDFATFSATYSPEAGKALEELGAQVGRPFLPVSRMFDAQLMELNAQGAYNGHVPVTAEMMLIGLAAAVLSGRRRVIFSNEASAGEGNVWYEGIQINHQYSKSPQYEQAFRRYLQESISPELDCFSLLRPMGDLRIGDAFARGPMQRYAGQFTSCNRSFRQGSEGFTWCGECPKCAFVFLVLAPFVPKDELVAIWGENLLAKKMLEPTYQELLGLSGHKPFECVGEIEECRQAVRMVLAGGQFPEVKRFEVPDADYDWRALHAGFMPDMYRKMLEEYLAQARQA
jgi:hypothetical protein